MRTWEDCAQFHGHKCPGLAIGYRAAVLAMEKLGLSEGSQDEELVCISENDACGVDAIQVITGCTAGKGNLIFHMTGKEAYSFYCRKSGKSILTDLSEGRYRKNKDEQGGADAADSDCPGGRVVCLQTDNAQTAGRSKNLRQCCLCKMRGNDSRAACKTGKRTDSLSGLLHLLP